MAIEILGMSPLLEVFDMPTSLGFYRDVIGFAVVAQSSPGDKCDWCLMRLADVTLMLNTAYENDDERPAVPDPARVRIHKDTALFFSCPDVDGAYGYLKERGVKSERPHNAPYGMRQLYLRDPDGYNLCFQFPVEEQ